MDKISVIVPVYNLEKQIECCVKSIREQIYENLEIILVDDGSEDGSLDIIQTLAEQDSRIIVIHQENAGVTNARITGINASTGEWIGFVDGDDYIEPEMYDVLIHNAEYYNADISHCGYQMEFPDRVDYYYGTGKLVEQNPFLGVKDLLEGSFVEPGLCNKLFRKSLVKGLLEDNIMDTSIKNLEDLLMNFYLFRKSKKSVFLDRCFYHYIVRNGSAATSKYTESKLRDPLKVFTILKNETKSEPEYQRILNGRMAGQLIRVSTLSLDAENEAMILCRTEARRQLKDHRDTILKGMFSNKLKIMVVWASIWPDSYCLVHSIYSKIMGKDKKFVVKEIEG